MPSPPVLSGHDAVRGRRLTGPPPRPCCRQRQGGRSMTDLDLVIRGGTVVDGSGRPAFEADVAIAGGRIAQVGKVTGRGAEEIDARGKLVTPGFVDIHTHYDAQATWSSRIDSSSYNGVTTAL